MKIVVYAPDLEHTRSWFEVPKRYYERNKELAKACDLLHAFISQEDGFTGGTRFEVEYAVTLDIPGPAPLGKWVIGVDFSVFFPLLARKPGIFLVLGRVFP